MATTDEPNLSLRERLSTTRRNWMWLVLSSITLCLGCGGETRHRAVQSPSRPLPQGPVMSSPADTPEVSPESVIAACGLELESARLHDFVSEFQRLSDVEFAQHTLDEGYGFYGGSEYAWRVVNRLHCEEKVFTATVENATRWRREWRVSELPDGPFPTFARVSALHESEVREFDRSPENSLARALLNSVSDRESSAVASRRHCWSEPITESGVVVCQITNDPWESGAPHGLSQFVYEPSRGVELRRTAEPEPVVPGLHSLQVLELDRRYGILAAAIHDEPRNRHRWLFAGNAFIGGETRWLGVAESDDSDAGTRRYVLATSGTSVGDHFNYNLLLIDIESAVAYRVSLPEVREAGAYRRCERDDMELCEFMACLTATLRGDVLNVRICDDNGYREHPYRLQTIIDRIGETVTTSD